MGKRLGRRRERGKVATRGGGGAGGSEPQSMRTSPPTSRPARLRRNPPRAPRLARLRSVSSRCFKKKMPNTEVGVCVGEWGCLACLVRKLLRADWYFSEEKPFVCWFGCLSAHRFQCLLFHSFSEENLKWQINITNTNIKAGEAFYLPLTSTGANLRRPGTFIAMTEPVGIKYIGTTSSGSWCHDGCQHFTLCLKNKLTQCRASFIKQRMWLEPLLHKNEVWLS